MSTETVETIIVDEKTRIVVMYDQDAESPLEWGDHETEDSETYKAWANGEVYGVIVQRLIDRYMLNEVNEPIASSVVSTWEDVDSIWSCYLDDVDTAAAVAKEYFGVVVPVTA